MDYYTELEVSGNHLYDTMADAEKSSYLATHSESHHLVTWTQHTRPSQYSALQSSQRLSQHYVVRAPLGLQQIISLPPSKAKSSACYGQPMTPLLKRGKTPTSSV
ncbi:hypothetical protein WJX75_000548 [Coccomyxa subellipsoidea]|uniref:Uncharacterized protein n=1 Tax=Coccomyxa subellipsoidea TaxID=248742 RepID=A0ABR2Z1F3_9CHLO